jgi:alkanesulfonate monooxygenase SsuD/methylene tetrahydromethanopterin reductase-like flavin-dependent oxidoreductase (luciferase family)
MTADEEGHQMRPSYQMFFAHYTDRMNDREFVQGEMRLAELAEPLGFGGIWCVEHHFDKSYSAMPDNMMVLSYLAARTEKIGLTPAAIILPWHDPVRVAERIQLLDIISGGRLTVGMGRGLSRPEYEQFGLDMSDARDRWQESLTMILEALNTGEMEGKGPHFKQPRVPIVPRDPDANWDDRLLVVVTSPESMELTAREGLRITNFIQFEIEKHRDLLQKHYVEPFEATHGRQAPQVTLSELMFCHEDADEAERLAYEYIGTNFVDTMRHYEFGDPKHFKETKGYESYAEVAELLSASDMTETANAYVRANTWGTPEQVLGQLEEKRDKVGDYHLNLTFSYGGMSHETAEQNILTFGQKVLPQLEKMGAAKA